jgi:hypothetical protein
MGLRHMLLLVQSALAGLIATEALILAAVLRNPLLLLIGVLAWGLAALMVVAAFALLKGRRWARRLAAGYQLLLLVSGYGNAMVLGNGDLVSVLVTLALPAALLWLLRRPATRTEAVALLA